MGSIAKVIEISAESGESFERAIRDGVAKANETVKNIRSAWVKEQQVRVEGGNVVGFRVNLQITFVVD